MTSNQPENSRQPNSQSAENSSESPAAESQSVPDSGAEMPQRGRLGGVDFGTVRIGLSISNRDQSLASPLSNFQRRGPDGDRKYFLKLAKEEEIVGWVVGLPIHMSGDESKKSLEARQFGAWLSETTQLPVAFHDERYSSSLADDVMQFAGLSKKKQKSRRDMLAAQIILSAFLEWRRHQTEELDPTSSQNSDNQ